MKRSFEELIRFRPLIRRTRTIETAATPGDAAMTWTSRGGRARTGDPPVGVTFRASRPALGAPSALIWAPCSRGRNLRQVSLGPVGDLGRQRGWSTGGHQGFLEEAVGSLLQPVADLHQQVDDRRR